MGQAPTRICIFLEIVFFLVFFVLSSGLKMFKKKKKKMDSGVGGWVLTDQSKFFSDFSIFFNLTRPLNNVKITKNTIFIKYQYSHKPDRYGLYFIVFLDLENIGLDTLFVHLRRLVFKLRTQTRSAIMAALNRAQVTCNLEHVQYTN